MDSADDDMIEAEANVPSHPPPPQTMPSEVRMANPGQDDVVRGFLVLARQLLDQGKPFQALQAVVMAMQRRGGNEAVFRALSRAQELYRNKMQASAAADELASLLAECAIAETLPSIAEPSQPELEQSVGFEAHGTSILAETGRKQVVLDAFSDGSSFICLRCGGLVSNHRKEEHYEYWCCKI